jgi:hypothetical protein
MNGNRILKHSIDESDGQYMFTSFSVVSPVALLCPGVLYQMLNMV